MERVSSTETVLMTTPKSPFKNSDIDFNDVFGGPPRRSLIQETTYSLTQTRHSFAKDDEKSSGRSSWSSEKPVFGEEGANRRYPSEDFFDDIFRGNESVTSPPRKHDITTPGSSPSGKFSLPAKLTKGKDIPVFGSSTRNSYSQSPLSRFSNEGQDDSRNGLQSFESPLWQKLSPSSEESSKPDETDLKKNSSISPQDIFNSGQFHFSIYKWASKGVPLVMPLRGGTSSRLKEVKLERISSSNGRMERRLPERVLDDSSQFTTDSFRMTFNDLLNDPEPEPCQIVEETNIPRFKTKPEIHVNTALEDTREENKPHSLHATKFVEKITSETPKDAQNESKSQISSLFVNDNEQQASVYEKGGDAKEKGSTAKSFKKSSSREIGKSIKKPDGERTTLDIGEKEKTNLHGSPVNSGDQQGVYEKTGDAKGKQSTRMSSKKPSSREKTSRDNSGNDAKGKVKDFIKIFNQEAPSKRKIGNDRQSQSLRSKEKGTTKIESEVIVSSNESVEGNLAPKEDIRNPIMEEKIYEQPEEQHFTTTTKYVSSQKKDTSESSTSSIPVDSKTFVVDTDEMFNENFEVKELTQDENKSPQKIDDVEDIQMIDTKIRQWAFGKEGNIRSLLSTLQYVLWTGSGWKPVPLMDIIEGNAVRKAYQRALLCLHPDKLQQKGAASYQKYIAEKVFDILQDAWTHFNSLGSL